MWINFVYSHFECSKCYKKINTFGYVFDFNKVTFVIDEHDGKKEIKKCLQSIVFDEQKCTIYQRVKFDDRIKGIHDP